MMNVWRLQEAQLMLAEVDHFSVALSENAALAGKIEAVEIQVRG